MDSIFTPSGYPLAVSSFDNIELPPCKLLRQRESFFSQSQEVQSPSTDYTEIEANFYEPQTPKLDYENLGHSTQFIQALSTFESIIDSSLQGSFNWEENRQIKPINKGQTMTKEETSDAETGSECEEDETVEFECWSDKKDKLLKNFAVKCKYDWKKIANKFNKSENSSFTPLALKQKYKKSSQVSIPLRVKFTHQEDLMIAKYFETYGCDWAQIATHFTDRSAIMLKNRYYSFIRKRNLLSSMLEEIKETCDRDTEVETQSYSQEVGFFVQDCEDRVIQKFSCYRFNESFFELDLELSAELHDKITPFTL